ncbi:MAG: glycosyl hydrolase [bacterium]|nr:glycosyl hydrolase [bacterium]
MTQDRTSFPRRATAAALLLLLGLAAADCGPRPRNIDLTAQKWAGRMICYSGYRAGQSPQTQTYPSQAEILEDMRILERHWRMIRTYGSDRHSEDVLQVIRTNKIPIRVMLGAWLSGSPGKETENEDQIRNCIRLANQYPDVVAAVSVGNEILVSWSDHRMTLADAIAAVDRVRDSVSVPVTVDDDFTFWREKDGRALAERLDFVAVHTYPMWGGSDIDSAMTHTVRHVESVQKALPGKTIVIGEAGWATYTVGPAHAPRAGDEDKQERYFRELHAWAKANGINVFYFEAFDEPWKGSGTEGHWGLFSEGRKAKKAMREWYPELISDEPTSPSYEM